MKEIIKIGIVIADADEFLPLENKMPQLGGKLINCFGKKAYNFKIESGERIADVMAVLCGIGKVNATAAATYLAMNGADIILNCGLSGGISGVKRHDITLPDRFLEHDFDLTGIGYSLCEKPGQDYIYSADKGLIELFKCVFQNAKIGTAVSGDCFVSDAKLRDKLKNEFSAMSCDMETAAIAYVCHAFGIKFAAARKISDDAGNDAPDDYRNLNELAESVLIDSVLEVIWKILGKK